MAKGARIVHVGRKPHVDRRAIAKGRLSLRRRTIDAIRAGGVPKGDVLATAQVAALQAVKRTHEMLPLCHPIPLTGADVKIDLVDGGVECQVDVRATYRTGVEMEALHGCAIALLTVWDMVKALEKDVRGQYPETSIGEIRVVQKVKGR